ncbi:hypothetical protein OHV35_15340 [Acinetobacter baumannii]|nr:hypothetical protein [Acinetobacter baumannii]MDO7332184.1 hypothetical protein [Acinetobacter baumannii]
MRQFTSLQVAILALGSLCFSTAYADSTLVPMSDAELSATRGQALMSMSYIAPTDSANLEKLRDNSSNIGFYKLGLEAELEINTNIRKLQLGCGGVNGAGGCDIDIDNLSLSGQNFDANGNPLPMSNEDRASSSAVLTNPFIEFAVKNPNSASTREVVGLRLSAEKFIGLLTAGTENTTTPNGINSISGYMKVQSDSSGLIKGYATTSATRDNLYGANAVTGRLQALGLGSLAEVEFITSNGGFNIPGIQNNYFEIAPIQVNGNRVTSKVLSAPVKVPNIYVGHSSSYPVDGTVQYNAAGPHDPAYPEPTGIYTQGGKVEATVTSCSNLLVCAIAGEGKKFSSVYMNGTISNITANLNLTQSLGLIHNLPINSPMYLALQNQMLQWPGAKADDVAQKGWWMSFANPVNVGNIIPQDAIDISPLFPQISTAVSAFLQANPAKTSDLDGLLLGADLDVNIGTIDLKNSPLTLNLSNLQLTNQNFKPNCHGSGLTFC